MKPSYRTGAVAPSLVCVATALNLLLLPGCAGDVIVAERDPETGTGGAADEPFVPEGVGIGMGGSSSACAEQFEARASYHNAWAAEENDFGDLTGSEWSGELLFIGHSGGGMKMHLDLGETAGSLDLGTPPPVAPESVYPDNGEMFLFSSIPVEDASYPLRGAQFENGELVLIIHPNSYLEEWCNLQTPYLDETNECSYMIHPNVGFGTAAGQPDKCELANDPTFIRDCDWFMQGMMCTCTPERCFAQTQFPDVQPHETAEDYSGGYLVARLTHDATAGTLVGSAEIANQKYHIELSRE